MGAFPEAARSATTYKVNLTHKKILETQTRHYNKNKKSLLNKEDKERQIFLSTSQCNVDKKFYPS